MKARIIGVTYFTNNGKSIWEKLKSGCKDLIIEGKPEDIDLSVWTKEAFECHTPLVFICAAGIAVRTIAPFVTSKLSDSPVIVIDELGKNVIPILSGHYGGANDIANTLAKALNASLIITTATDINNVFAIDVFARDNGFKIINKDGIKDISKKVLNGGKISIKTKIDNNIVGQVPKEVEIIEKGKADVVISDEASAGFTLIPKRLVLGMGCKKGKSFKELLTYVTCEYSIEYLRENLYAIATIDVKENEVGLIKLAQFFGAKFLTYTSKELQQVKGDFPDSEFVKDTVGVSNVCERAAVLGAGLSTRDLLLEKTADNGITLAAATRKTIDLKF
ncbi:cobalt-precorrin 5A hydrolase [Pseudobutyrivibrio ruminis]|uniref:Cobalt-precorrin 5A acetaldehyde-lyase n=1 Tax=Pseudobutyrivibrio ruminis DSM 9787 TaxID=1123011 RepID=A0A285SY90_9FIRM|nr:cobalamin biosynthesis protein [Pseudobutyrivibrio ruminis]SOC13678.1 cobalt-precorrin 5A acetaldehyde-lyase [Pseudobutyrivibrio ruminis DSM 9787]